MHSYYTLDSKQFIYFYVYTLAKVNSLKKKLILLLLVWLFYCLLFGCLFYTVSCVVFCCLV